MHYKFTSITISNVAFGMSYRWFLHNSIEQHNYAKQQSNAVHRDGSMGAVSHQCSLLVLHGSAAARTHWIRSLRGSTGATSAVLAPRPSWLAGVALDFGENPAEPKQQAGVRPDSIGPWLLQTTSSRLPSDVKGTEMCVLPPSEVVSTMLENLVPMAVGYKPWMRRKLSHGCMLLQRRKKSWMHAEIKPPPPFSVFFSGLVHVIDARVLPR